MSLQYAWAFLTRLPGGAHPDDERGLGRSVPWFPVVGSILGGLLGVLWLGLAEVLAPIPAATLTVLTGVLLTGAFHEDGLADTADALGGYEPARRLEIMKDSRVGTFGVLALVFSVLLRVTALGALDPVDGLVAIVAAHTIGRSIATVVMITVPAASTTGLGQSYSAHLPRSAVLAVAALVAAAAAVGGPASLIGYAAAAIGAVAVASLARRAFGGTTGDVLGAVEQVGEIAVLLAAATLVTDHGWTWT